jgi:hypothetical protein
MSGGKSATRGGKDGAFGTKFRRDSQGSLPKIAFLAYLNEKTTEL